jgi:FAD/FMN-containing dehydrogenase
MTSAAPDLLRALRHAAGEAQVLTDADLRAGYQTDWTGRWRGDSVAVVRPTSTDAVAGLLAACLEHGAAVIPQGGNTGLVGGSVPRVDCDRPQVVVSVTRLTELGDVDVSSAEVTVGAGVTLSRLQGAARAAGLTFGVDLGARDSATLGGMIATNAGGMQVFRYGPMRAQLVGIEAVMADGSVVRRLRGLVKDNTGYHLPSLLAGSEGTLAVVTAARVRLVPLLPRRAVALMAVDGADEAAELTGVLRRRLPNLIAAELFFDEGMDLVLRHTGGERPFADAHPAYLLVEVEGRLDPTDELAAAVAAAESLVRDAVLATDEAARQRLWRLRERHTESLNAEGVPHKLDVAVPVGELGRYAAAVREAVASAAPGARTYLYGHVAEGNLHVNVLGPLPEDETVDEVVLRLVIEMGGTISAEHGIGVAKTAWLDADRGAADVAAMRAIKRALDPEGIMNPGVIFGTLS